MTTYAHANQYRNEQEKQTSQKSMQSFASFLTIGK